MKRLLPFALLALGACRNDPGPAPGAVTDNEAKALDAAGQMIEGQPLPSETPAPTAT